MAVVITGRLKETTAVTGASTMTLLGAVSGFRAFGSAVGTGNQTHYLITDSSAYESGIGTVTVVGSTTTLSRDAVFYSSNGGAQVAWSAGTKTVFGGIDGNASTIRGALNLDYGLGVTPIGSTIVANFSVVALSGATTLVATDRGKYFDCSGQFTITLSSSNVLGTGWRSRFRNAGASTVTITGASVTSFDLAGDNFVEILCIGTAFRNVSQQTSANATQMKAVTANNVIATPKVVHNHPGVAKCWHILDSFDGSPNVGYNLLGFGDNGTGDKSTLFSTAMSTTGYSGIIFVDLSEGSTRQTMGVGLHTKATTSIRYLLHDDVLTQREASVVNVAVWGDQ